jgi:hypothetical protein
MFYVERDPWYGNFDSHHVLKIGFSNFQIGYIYDNNRAPSTQH